MIEVRCLKDNLLLASQHCTKGNTVQVSPDVAAFRVLSGDVELVNPGENSPEYREAMSVEQMLHKQRLHESRGEAPYPMPTRPLEPVPVMVEVRVTRSGLFGSTWLDAGQIATLTADLAAFRVLEGSCELTNPAEAPHEFRQAVDRQKADQVARFHMCG